MAGRLALRRFFFLRHGETEWNARGLVMGQRDIALNSAGECQAQAVAPLVAGLPVAAVVASPLARAHATALAVAGDKAVALDGRLKEADFGARCGGPREDTFSFRRWLRGEECPVGAETGAEFTERVLGGVGEALQQPGPVLLVAHGGVFKALCYVLGVDERRCGNCALFVFDPPADGLTQWTVTQLNG